jgi:hypothetical protein
MRHFQRWTAPQPPRLDMAAQKAVSKPRPPPGRARKDATRLGRARCLAAQQLVESNGRGGTDFDAAKLRHTQRRGRANTETSSARKACVLSSIQAANRSSLRKNSSTAQNRQPRGDRRHGGARIALVEKALARRFQDGRTPFAASFFSFAHNLASMHFMYRTIQYRYLLTRPF